jgi:HK97 family phage prohead protease
MERRDIRLLDTKASADTPGQFAGYGAVFGNVDATGDVIQAGAFSDTLKEWKSRGKLPPMLLQHGGGVFGGGAEDMLPVGEWTSMEENRRGLKVEGQLFALGTEKGQYIYEGLRAGALDGLSIGFQTRESITGTRAGEPDRILTNLDLWEVSIVTFPANPKARVTAVKALTLDTLRDLEGYLYRDLQEFGFSKSDAKRAIATIRKYLQRDAGEDSDGQRDAAAAGEFNEHLEMLHLQDLLTHITTAGGRH